MNNTGDQTFRRYREVATLGLRPLTTSTSLRNGDRVLVRNNGSGLPLLCTLYGPPGARAWFEQLANGLPVPGLLDFAEFFALMPGDNAAPVPVGSSVEFPQDGPTAALGITRTGPATFQLAAIGIYRVTWQASIAEPGQLMLGLNGGLLPNTVMGRATGTNQINGECYVTVAAPNSILTVLNPPGNAAALTLTPIAGGTHAVSATLLIERYK